MACRQAISTDTEQVSMRLRTGVRRQLGMLAAARSMNIGALANEILIGYLFTPEVRKEITHALGNYPQTSIETAA